MYVHKNNEIIISSARIKVPNISFRAKYEFFYYCFCNIPFKPLQVGVVAHRPAWSSCNPSF